MDKMLVEHVVKPHLVMTKTRDNKGNVIVKEKVQVGRMGTFVGINDSGRVRVGWSVVNFHAGDKFNADAGIAFATVKALNQTPVTEKLDRKYKLCKDFQIFKKRCSKFFKGITVEGYDPKADAFVDALEADVNEDKEKALREALRNVLPANAKFLADGPIMGFGDGMAIPINLGHAETDILKLIGSVTDLMAKRVKKNK